MLPSNFRRSVESGADGITEEKDMSQSIARCRQCRRRLRCKPMFELDVFNVQQQQKLPSLLCLPVQNACSHGHAARVLTIL